MEYSVKKLLQRDADVLLHPNSNIEALIENGPDMMLKGSGCMLESAAGQALLDGVAGLWCVNAGYGREELVAAMAEGARSLSYYHAFTNASNPWQVALADRLLADAPAPLAKVFFGMGGSDANDTLIKIAWHYHYLRGEPRKIKVIARHNAYHGTSIATSGLTGLPVFHKGYPLPQDYILRIQSPHYFAYGQANESEEAFCHRLIAEVETLIDREGADTIAALIAEPVMGAGGVIVPPEGYYRALQPLLKKHNILFILDEVISGFGRLGKPFAADLFDLQPDMMSCAKGLTSGYFPVSAAVISDVVWNTLRAGSKETGGFYHGYTYSGHPVGAAVGLANLDLIEKESLVMAAKEKGRYLHEKLRERLLPHPLVGEIRGRGLLAGVQLVKNRETRELPAPEEKWPQQVVAVAREKGVIIRPLPSVATLALSPPFIITESQIDQLTDALLAGIDSIRRLA